MENKEIDERIRIILVDFQNGEIDIRQAISFLKNLLKKI